ncbi:SLC13 family permease [Alkalicoccus daliensis]|uniref:Anion transporter n=1 Tax=Alkalicoccus daliensis TaxID=745820 RepID=A0A1H0KR42_9BACI|nr:SLC13 family permease [Alkalicoccus daliensis]SDO58231.1 anion transporter [Alkalicoccus daliensis]
MTIEIGIVLTIVLLMLLCLIKEIARPDIILSVTLLILLFLGVVEPAGALNGFMNEGMWTVGLLFIVAGAVQQNQLLHSMVLKGLGTGKGPRRSVMQMMFPIASLSAFLNNTPIVVIFAPIIRRWCERKGIAPSKFLMPLSFAAIFGGTLTLIGTSTNLIVHGFMLDRGLEGFSMFQLAIVGLPACLIGIIYMSTFGYKLLPNRQAELSYAAPANEPKAANTAKKAGFESYFSIIVLVSMVLMAAFEVLSMFEAALAASAVLILTRVVTLTKMVRSVQFEVLLLIAAAIGIGTAMEQSGTASYLAEHLVSLSSGWGVVGALIVIFLLTSIFTEVITNNAAAVLMFPVAFATAQQLGADPTGFFVAIAIAASASFATPIGYQTNLIIYRPGGYRFTDYIKVGMPLNVLYLVVTVGIVSFVWL